VSTRRDDTDDVEARLARRYEWLLYAYPVGYRQRHGDEILGTLLDAADAGQRAPKVAEAVDLLFGGICRRLGLSAGAVDEIAARAAPLAMAFVVAVALLGLRSGPAPSLDGVPGPLTEPAMWVNLLWVVAALCRLSNGWLCQAAAPTAITGTLVSLFLPATQPVWPGPLVLCALLTVFGGRRWTPGWRLATVGGAGLLACLMAVAADLGTRYAPAGAGPPFGETTGTAAGVLAVLAFAGAMAYEPAASRLLRGRWLAVVGILMVPLGLLLVDRSGSLELIWRGSDGLAATAGTVAVLVILIGGLGGLHLAQLPHRAVREPARRALRAERRRHLIGAVALGCAGGVAMTALWFTEVLGSDPRQDGSWLGPLTIDTSAYLLWLAATAAWAWGHVALTRITIAAAALTPPGLFLAEHLTGVPGGTLLPFHWIELLALGAVALACTQPSSGGPASGTGELDSVDAADGRRASRILPLLLAITVPLLVALVSIDDIVAPVGWSGGDSAAFRFVPVMLLGGFVVIAVLALSLLTSGPAHWARPATCLLVSLAVLVAQVRTPVQSLGILGAAAVLAVVSLLPGRQQL
jgi:hypothetical protein